MKTLKSHTLKTIIKLMTGFDYDRSYELMEMDFKFFLPKECLPSGFKYPEEYVEFSTQDKIPDLEPWHFFNSISTMKHHHNGLKQRYPNRSIIPFARRRDNDDVACFDGTDTSGNPRVFIVHDFASPGWEGRGECENFNEWLKLVKDESEEWKQSQ